MEKASVFEKMKSRIPEGKRGVWAVEKFTVVEKDVEFQMLRAACGAFGSGGRTVPTGTYTMLTRGGNGICGDVVMSDTPDEIRDHLPFIEMARGKVLITGLGLGIVARACLQKGNVGLVTVVEKNQEVIDLVAEHLFSELCGTTQKRRLKIVKADAFKWLPFLNYDWCWHDIWPNICKDYLNEAVRLRERYASFCRSQRTWIETVWAKRRGRW